MLYPTDERAVQNVAEARADSPAPPDDSPMADAVRNLRALIMAGERYRMVMAGSVGLGTTEACGDVPRVVLGSPVAGIAADIPPETAGFCLDTGHAFYAGMDPAALLERYADRLDYIHFKDIDPAVFRRVMGERIRFFEACAQGVMCPIGRGRIDYPGLRRLLTEIGYAGYITIEQERDPRNAGGALADLAASREFLRRTGF